MKIEEYLSKDKMPCEDILDEISRLEVQFQKNCDPNLDSVHWKKFAENRKCKILRGNIINLKRQTGDCVDKS